MKIAIVGAGISGLVAAYHLHRDHEITVFEANDYLGGHTNTVEVDDPAGRIAVDTGFIVYNERTYPEFARLLGDLGVGTQSTEMSFSVRDPHRGLEYNGHSLDTLFAQRRNLLRPGFYHFLGEITRFNRLATGLGRVSTNPISVDEFVRRHRFSARFVRDYLLPLGSAIWSCPLGEFRQFPMQLIAEFYRNHGLLQLRGRPIWRVVRGGSRVYVDALVSDFRHRVRLREPIQTVRRRERCVEVFPRRGGVHRCDHVVFACHSDQALAMLGAGATAAERSVLSAFPYVANRAVLHTDVAMLPRARRAWASWNYLLSEDESSPAMVTYLMNRLQRLSARNTYCVTLNLRAPIEASRILGEFIYHHPVFDARRAAAQARRDELLTAQTSFCGAYWGNGFHEDGVVSGLAVVESIRALEQSRSTRRALPVSPPRRTEFCVGAAV